MNTIAIRLSAACLLNSSAAAPSWRRRAAGALALALLCATAAQAAPVFSGSPDRSTPRGIRDLVIFDQNLYVGAEFTPVLGLDPTDPSFPLNLLMGVAQIYQTIVASDFPRRAEALAGQIAAARPDLIALQEVALIRMQVPGDFVVGGSSPATDVDRDYLEILLANLDALGLHYAAVAVATNFDMELPMPIGDGSVFADVRLTDHDVILARMDAPSGHLRVRRPQAGNFQAALPLPGLGVSIPRGWCAVDVITRGREVRFINAHLEENTAAPVQAAQALELLAGPAQTPLPVVLAGDFNSDANGTDGTTAYGLLTQCLADAWTVAHPLDPGLTWGHDPWLADPGVAFVWRLDLVLFRGPALQLLDIGRVALQFQDTPPFWLSDHAGLLARFRAQGPVRRRGARHGVAGARPRLVAGS
ncbi:MAG: endonuclease/exonuclease/phosphatase family protein [Verrucomicrobia bacterium]|nr:endonuclease/exonuclease/phosphatase family protein [Verrucomicrobiota bacterium]